jgi:glycosyltransferase involved in cell wall biosynthesis
MRVLHVNTEKGWRGGERQTLLTALEQRRLGVDSQIACRKGTPLEQAAAAGGVPVIALSPGAPSALPALARAAADHDVLHCHTGKAHSLGALATVIRRRPLVVSRRVDFVPSRSWFNRWKYGRADRVICVSRAIAGIMRDWGLPEQNLPVVYEAVPGDDYLPREQCLERLRALTGVKPGRRLIGNIAAMVPHKDQATLLRGAKIVCDRFADVSFVVLGDGELRENLLRLRGELGLAERVHLPGQVPQAQQLLPGFDVFAMSSNMEGLGTIVLDAGLAGVPVAVTAAGGLSEAVLDGQTGLLVPVGNHEALAAALVRLLEEPGLGSRLAAAARERVRENFSVRQMAQRTLDIYQEVMAGNR